MGFQIIDGKGRGYLAEVNPEQELVVRAITETEFEHATFRGDSYSWTNVTYDMTADDTIIAVRNISSTRKLHIDRIFQSSDVATVADIHVVQGSAALAGTVITGINLNFASGNVAEADARGDETTNSSQGSLILTTELLAATTQELDFQGSIILGTNDAIAIDHAANAAITYATIFGYYAESV